MLGDLNEMHPKMISYFNSEGFPEFRKLPSLNDSS